jgi:3'-phosphoadenosine 5'-phosphosulfate sulfotransferase (PAPS reductase)/FAD synthetase
MNEIKNKYSIDNLKVRQSMPLDMKEVLTEQRIRQWYEHFNGQVYVSFSGGKDSTVLLNIVRKLYPHVPAVFVDTGLEYPEIREFVKTVDNVVWIKPKIPFNEVIKKYGYPVVSKKVARFIQDLQNNKGNNLATKNLRLTGFNRAGIYCPSQKIPKKWLKLVGSEFRCSDKCCEIIKKEPLKRFHKKEKRFPITAVMACESSMREKQYLSQGCNAFDSKTNKISMPMAFWTENDIWEYIKKYNIPYSKIYDMGEKRTGCTFCMFGCHLEKSPNRFERMKISHPNYYKYCMENLGIAKLLDFLNIKH